MNEDDLEEETEEEDEDEELDDESIAAIKKAVSGRTVQSLKKKMNPSKEVSKDTDDIELMKIATQHELAFKIPSGKILSYEEYLVWLGNLVWRIKKSVA